MLKTIPAFGALLLASVLVVPTVSQAETTNSVRVHYADLNLASDSGRAALDGRIAYAARIVCEIEDSRELPLAAATNACRSGAIADAQPAVDAAVASMRRGSVTVAGAALIVTAR